MTMETGNGQSEGGRSGYQKLQAWRSSDDLAVELFKLTKSWDRDVIWLKSQILRAAISVPANIAEGYARGPNREFLRFLSIAHASLAEVEYFLHFLERIDRISTDDLVRLREISARAGRTLFGLMKLARSDLGGERGVQRYLREEQAYYDYAHEQEIAE